MPQKKLKKKKKIRSTVGSSSITWAGTMHDTLHKSNKKDQTKNCQLQEKNGNKFRNNCSKNLILIQNF